MLKRFDWKKYDWKIYTVCSVALLTVIGLVAVTVMAIVNAANAKTISAQTYLNGIATYEKLDNVDTTGKIVAAERCLDYNGNLMAYAVTAYGEGLYDKIAVKCFFNLDKKTLIGITVAQHNEKGVAAEIADSPFRQRFEYAKMPLWLYDGTVPLETLPKQDGTRIDALDGAQVSSAAVVQAANTAYTYYVESVL